MPETITNERVETVERLIASYEATAVAAAEEGGAMGYFATADRNYAAGLKSALRILTGPEEVAS